MKILLSNYRYFVSGGPERYLLQVQKLLQDHNHEVFPFSVSSKHNLPNAYESRFLSPVGDGSSVYFDQYSHNFSNLTKILARQFYSPEAYLKGASFAKFCKPDIAYSLQYLNKMSPSLLDGFKSAGVPVVVRISDFGMICPQAHLFDGNAPCTRCIRGSLLNPIAVRCVRNSRAAGLIKSASLMLHRLLRCRDRIDAFVFPSRFTLERFEEAGLPAKKLHWIPTPIDFTAIPTTTEVGTNILYFGRLTREKGVHQLVEAYRNISGEKAKLVIVGDILNSTYDQELREMDSGIQLNKFVPSEQLTPYIHRSLCVVVPSVWYENMPNVVLETYAHGRPVIAPDHGCFPEIVEHGKTGLLYKAGDVNSLKEALTWAMANASEMAEMGRNARLLVETKYTQERHYDSLMATFSKVLH